MISVDELFASTTMLCPFTTDYKSVAPPEANITTYGNIAISSAQSKFGTASMATDGVGDYIYALTTTNILTTDGNFTIEGWTRITAFANPVNTIFNLYQDTSHRGIRLSALSDGRLRFELLDDVVSVIHPLPAPLLTWFHWAVTKDDGQLRAWLNGVPSEAIVQSTAFTPVRLYIAEIGWNTSADGLYGNFNELRVTKDVARYTEAFTPPTAPFPRYGAALVGAVFGPDGLPAARTVRAHDRATGALLATTTSDALTGTYEFGVALPGTEVQLVCLDDEDAPVLTDLLRRVVA